MVGETTQWISAPHARSPTCWRTGAASRRSTRRIAATSISVARVHHPLVILRQPPMTRDPGKRALNDPSARLHSEAVRAGLALRDLELPTATLLSARLRQLLASGGGVRPDLLEPRHKASKAAEESAGTNGIVHVGRDHMPSDGQGQRVDQQMPLPAFDELAAIVAADAARLLNGLDALAISDRRARIGLATRALAIGAMQGRIERMRGVRAAELPEVVIHWLPSKEIAGEIAPRTAGAQRIEDGVEDATQGVRVRSAALRPWWQVALNALPFRIGQVARGARNHAPERTP